ncbi:MAG: hypothetical protein PUA64_01780 [Treponema sp.]|nr:hypothetical protein [Treponema sp.]
MLTGRVERKFFGILPEASFFFIRAAAGCAVTGCLLQVLVRCAPCGLYATPPAAFFAKSSAFFWFYKKLCYNQIIVKKNDCKNIFYGFGNVYFFKALLILSLNSQVKSLLENWEKTAECRFLSLAGELKCLGRF